VTVDLDAARRDARQADDRVDRRGLSGAVRAEKSKEIACTDAQRNAVNRGEVTVPLDDVCDLEGGRLAV
jgi:hypothetical protein